MYVYNINHVCVCVACAHARLCGNIQLQNWRTEFSDEEGLRNKYMRRLWSNALLLQSFHAKIHVCV